MTKQERERFRQRLIGMKEELEAIEETLSQSGETVELDQTRLGRLSRMDAMQGQQMALEAGRRQKQKMRDIAAALRRVESDEFGFCIECGEDIGIRRLDTDATHTHCINCAE